METINKVQGATGNKGKISVKGPAKKAAQLVLDELTTIDGVCISISARAAAIKRGAGVMIGDYFVGVTTGTELLFSHPAIVY